MKRYCLTDCAKIKLSKVKKRIIDSISIIAAIFALLLTVTILLAGLGYCLEYLIAIGWAPAPNTPFKNIFDAGGTALSLIFLTGVVGTVVYFTVSWLFNTFRSIGTSIAHRMDPDYDHESCQLFEECKDE